MVSKTLAAIVVCLFGYAFSQPNHVNALKGYKICKFPIFSLTDGAFDWDKINKYVSDKISAYGIKTTPSEVLDCMFNEYGTGKAYFYSDIVYTPPKNGIVGVNINIYGIEFKNRVYSDRYLILWENSQTVLLGSSAEENQNTIKSAIGDMIETLISDYRKSNVSK